MENFQSAIDIDYKSKQQQEVRDNLDALQKIKVSQSEEIAKHSNEYALMKSKKITGYYNTWEEAEQAGKKLFDDNVFSIQSINELKIDLGYISHAVVSSGSQR